MKFDFGEILTRAWQITWKHKKLWVYAMLPFVIWALYLPLFMLVFPWGVIENPTSSSPILDFLERPGSETILVVGLLGTTALAFLLQLFGNAALTLGVVRAESGQETQGLIDLFKASLLYVGRILGAMLLIGLAVFIGLVAFTACSAAVSMVTFGIGSIFLQFLLYPIMFAVAIVSEQSQAGIVADDLGVTDALSRAWDLLTSHIWKFLLIGVVIYIVRSVLASFITVPMVIPMWFVMFNSLASEAAPPDMSMLWLSMLCMVAALPFYVVFMGITTTYTRAAFVVTYRRLTRDSEARQEFLKAMQAQEEK